MEDDQTQQVSGSGLVQRTVGQANNYQCQKKAFCMRWLHLHTAMPLAFCIFT